MIETRQLLHIVAIVETVHNCRGLRGGDIVIDLQAGCPAIINNAYMPEAMFGVTPPSEDDFAIKVTLQPMALKNTLQPALQRTATVRRLLVRLGRLWAMRAFGGSLQSMRSTV
jgi:hypothetical protein